MYIVGIVVVDVVERVGTLRYVLRKYAFLEEDLG